MDISCCSLDKCERQKRNRNANFVGTLLLLAQRKYIDATLPWRCLNKNADGEEKSHDKLRSKERKLIWKHFHSQGQQRYGNRSTKFGMVFWKVPRLIIPLVSALSRSKIFMPAFYRMVVYRNNIISYLSYLFHWQTCYEKKFIQ